VAPKLRSNGLDIDGAIQQGSYISLDAAEIRVANYGGLPDGLLLIESLSGLMKLASAAVRKPDPRIAISGESCGLLCAEGNGRAAIQLEKIANYFATTHNLEILRF
jgi:hypothetical protein